MHFSLFLFILISFSNFARAASEERVHLPTAEFTGSASFETLVQDTFVPVTSYPLSGERATTIDALKWNTPYNLKDYGNPGGAIGVNLGGRSSEDTQVTTLGIPLNLPQGGGANFSIFPDFLWDEVNFSPTTSGAGFAPGASSGHIDFIPWTRARVLNRKGLREASRATVSYDRDSQTYSLGTLQKNSSVLLGASTGRVGGIAGEVSSLIYRDGSSQVLFHMIGTQEKSDSPGSISYPTPNALVKNLRILPVLESEFKLTEDFSVQSTAYADFSNLLYNNPGSSSSDTRTQQFGLENAVVYGLNTLAFSARYIQFTGASYGKLHEVPFYAAYTRELFLSEETSFKATLNGTYLAGTGICPGGRASFKFAESEKIYPFAEFNTVAKMPTLVDRFSAYGNFFQGNPNLKPERVYAILGGYHFEQDQVKSTSTLKAEYRRGIQVATHYPFTSTIPNTVLNSGDAYLMSFTEELRLPILYWLDFRSNSLFTYSRLRSASYPYPDIPYLATTLGLLARYHDQLSLGVNARLIGVSSGIDANGAPGAFHSGYALFETEANYYFSKAIFLTGGIDNLFNSDAQAVNDYRLEGRKYFAALSAAL